MELYNRTEAYCKSELCSQMEAFHKMELGKRETLRISAAEAHQGTIQTWLKGNDDDNPREHVSQN